MPRTENGSVGQGGSLSTSNSRTRTSRARNPLQPAVRRGCNQGIDRSHSVAGTARRNRPMPLTPAPATVTASPFSSMRGHHAAIRYPDFETAHSFWVDTMDWRVLQTWPYGDLTLAYVMPPDQDDFLLEILAGPGAGPQAVYTDVDASLAAPGFNHVCLSVDSVDDTLAALRERGVDIV